MSEQGVQSLVDKHARACLADFLHSPGNSRPVVAIVRAPGATVVVAAFPPSADHDVPDLTECDQAVLTLLAGKNIHFPAQRIRDELETKGLYICSLNRDQVGTRSFASNSGSSSNLGQRRSTRATGSRLMRAMKTWQAPIKSGTLWWQKPRVTSSRIQSHRRSMGLRSGL